MRCVARELPTPQTERTILGVGYATAKMAIYLMNKGNSQFIGMGVQPCVLVQKRRFSRKMDRFSGNETRKTSPIEIALQYAAVLKDPSVTSKAEVARRFGVSRARVCQVLKLLALDERILEFLKATNRAAEPAQVTERKLRPIAVVRDRKQQVRMFNDLINQLYNLEQIPCTLWKNKWKEIRKE